MHETSIYFSLIVVPLLRKQLFECINNLMLPEFKCINLIWKGLEEIKSLHS